MLRQKTERRRGMRVLMVSGRRQKMNFQRQQRRIPPLVSQVAPQKRRSRSRSRSRGSKDLRLKMKAATTFADQDDEQVRPPRTIAHRPLPSHISCTSRWALGNPCFPRSRRLDTVVHQLLEQRQQACPLCKLCKLVTCRASFAQTAPPLE